MFSFKTIEIKILQDAVEFRFYFQVGLPVNRGLHNEFLQIIIQNSICNIKLILDFEFEQKNNEVLSYADLNNFQGKCRTFRASIRSK
jgi:hypothetical protein